MGITAEQWFTVGMGIGTVFLGLIAIILLCKIIGLFCSAATKKEEEKAVAKKTAVASQPIENRQEIIAAVSAVIAEELGTEINALKILSFKKI